MREYTFKLGVSFIFFCFLFVSCIDNGYDLSKDIDATVGLGAEGLGLKFGNTDTIFMRNILKVEDNEMLDTLPSTHLYYLVKNGTVTSSTTINNTNPVNIASVIINITALTPSTTVTYPAGSSFLGNCNSSSSMVVNVNNIDAGIKEVATVVPNDMMVTGRLTTNVSGVSISPEGIKVRFPDFVYSSQLTNHVLTLAANQTIFTLKVDSIVMPKTGTFGKAPENQSISLGGEVAVNGDATFKALQDIIIPAGSSVGAKLELSFTSMQPRTVSGLISKSVDPEVDNISISNDLPDFLQDGSVKLEISNPTLKIWTTNGTNWPFFLLFKGTLNSVLNSVTIATAYLPSQTGTVGIPGFKDQTYYFSQTSSPFDISAISTTAEKYTVPTLSKLVEKLPDYIQIDLKDNKVGLNPNVLQRVDLGKTYNFNLGYSMLVPFSFNADTKIIYKDSIDDLNDDLKDYEASGLKLTADIENDVPLDLNVEVIPCDVNGNSLANEITVTTETAKAATSTGPTVTPITCVLTTTNPASVKKLDKLILKVSASASESGSLMSSQYLLIKNIRLALTGQIIGDFN